MHRQGEISVMRSCGDNFLTIPYVHNVWFGSWITERSSFAPLARALCVLRSTTIGAE